jgi:hypothetical protein
MLLALTYNTTSINNNPLNWITIYTVNDHGVRFTKILVF